MLTLTVPFAEVVDRYQEDFIGLMGRERRVNTHRLRKLKGAFGTETVLTPSLFMDFFWSRSKQAPASRNRYRALLNHLMGWAGRMELATGMVPKLQMERLRNERTRRLEKGEEARLVAAMDQDLRDIFHAALDTGLRKGALLQLTFGDLQDGMLVVPATIQKHGQSQRIPLTARMVEIVARRSSAPEDRIFRVPYFEKRWQQAKQAAGVRGLHFHDLRGEFASRLSEKGVGVDITSKLLGHANLSTTQRYLRPRTEAFIDAIQRLNS